MSNNKNNKTGITFSGKELENHLVSSIPELRHNSDESAKGKKKGDLVIEVDGKDEYVEVKTNSTNQTRPVHYIPLVVHHLAPGYLVIPASVLVERCLKEDGFLRSSQHGGSPLDNTSFGPATTGWMAAYACPLGDIASRLSEYIRQDKKRTDLIDLLDYHKAVQAAANLKVCEALTKVRNKS